MTTSTPESVSNGSMRWVQVTFASFGASSQRRTGGWQAGPSVDASRAHIDWIKQNATTDLAPIEPISDYIGDETVDALPRNFSYFPDEKIAGETVSVYMQAVPAGRDSTNRPGNVFTHAYIDTDPWSETTPYYPVDRFGSDDFARPFTIKMVDKVALSRIDEGGGPSPCEGFVPTADEAIRFVCEVPQRAGALYRIQDALQSGATTVVLLVPDRQLASIWLKAISVTMSPLESQRLLRFSTFMRGNTVAGVGKPGAPALVCVPTCDASVIPSRSDIVVVSPDNGGSVPTTAWSKDTAEFLIRDGDGPSEPMQSIVEQYCEHTQSLRQHRQHPHFGLGLHKLFSSNGEDQEPFPGAGSDDGFESTGQDSSGSFWDTDEALSGSQVVETMPPEPSAFSSIGTAVAADPLGGATASQNFRDSDDTVPPSWENPPELDAFTAQTWGSAEASSADIPSSWEDEIIGELQALGCSDEGWSSSAVKRLYLCEVSPPPPGSQGDRALSLLIRGLSSALAQAGEPFDQLAQRCIDAVTVMIDLALTSGLVSEEVLFAHIRNQLDDHDQAIVAWCGTDQCPRLSPQTQRIIGNWWTRSVEKDTNTLKRLLGNAGSMTSVAKRKGLDFIHGDPLQIIEELGYRVLYSSRAASTREVTALYSLVADKLAEVSQTNPEILPIPGALVDQWEDWYSYWENRHRIETIITATNRCGYSTLNFATALGTHIGMGQVLTRLRAGFEPFLPSNMTRWPLSSDWNALLALLRLDFTVVDFGSLQPLLSLDGSMDRALRGVVRQLLNEAMDWESLQRDAETTLWDDIEKLYSTVLEEELKGATAQSTIRAEHTNLLRNELMQYQASRSANPSMYHDVRCHIIKLYLSSGSQAATTERP